VLALTDPAAYQRTFPGCYVLNGDINEDGRVDFGGIHPFIKRLNSGGGNPIPCP